MVLGNTAAREHALVGARSPAARVVELHAHLMDGGLMRMRRVERVALPPGDAVRLGPGGLHLMLIGLEGPLAPGDRVPLTLEFEDGTEAEVTAPVRRPEPMAH
jgi:copper(I)-binding protein